MEHQRKRNNMVRKNVGKYNRLSSLESSKFSLSVKAKKIQHFVLYGSKCMEKHN